MGGATCTLGGVAFNALAGATAGRYCLECFPENFEYVKRRFHAPGVTGNFIVRGGRNGGRIVARVRYIGAFANVGANYIADKNAWNNTAVTVIDQWGGTYLTCNLSHGRPASRPMSMGRGGGLCVMDAEFIFNYDG